MNPSVWGPPLWRVMTDVAWKADTDPDPNVQKYAKLFFQSLAFLLPCKYCRRSYQKYLQQLEFPDTPQKKHYSWLRFVFDLKNLVNRKLGQDTSLPWEVFLRRVFATSPSGSALQLMDLVAIFALNQKKNHVEKKYLFQWIAVLPAVTPYPELSALLLERPLDLKHLHTQASFFQWWYSLYSKLQHCVTVPSLAQVLQKYQNSRAQQLEPLECPSPR